MDVTEQDLERLLFHDPPLMFAFLAEAFRELEEIMNRVRRTFLSAAKTLPRNQTTLLP